MKQFIKMFIWTLLINLTVLSGLQAGVINKVTKTVFGKKAPIEYADKNIVLELWNKKSTPISVKTTPIDGDISTEGMVEVQPGGLFFKNANELNNNQHFYINFYDASGQVTDIYDIDPQGKTVYVRIKTEKGKDIFGSETGALKGIVRSTDTGLSLKNNISDKNIRKVSDANVAATRNRAAESEQFGVPGQETAQSILGISLDRQPTNITMADAYKILQLQPGATKADAVRSWKQLSLKWHPDKVSSEQGPVAEEIFKFITAAKEKIK